jgi:hypothetical protein
MPKCLDCGHTGSFVIREFVVKTAFYDESGIVYDAKYEDTEAVVGLACNACESKNLVGRF